MVVRVGVLFNVLSSYLRHEHFSPTFRLASPSTSISRYRFHSELRCGYDFTRLCWFCKRRHPWLQSCMYSSGSIGPGLAVALGRMAGSVLMCSGG